MLKAGTIIQNSNGMTYKVVADLGSYTLLENISGKSDKYVVAWLLNEYESGYSWGQGHYFANEENAKQCFKEKTGFTVEFALEMEQTTALSFDECRCLDCGTVYDLKEGKCPRCGSGYIDFDE